MLTFFNMDLKVPPNNEVVESAMIWALMIDSEIVEPFFQNWELEWFYDPIQKTIAKAIFALWLEWKDIDLISVQSELERTWKLEGIGWMIVLMEATENGICLNWRTYAEELHGLYKKRELIKECSRLLTSCYKEGDLSVSVENSFTKINSILGEGESSATNMEDNIKMLEAYIEANKGKDLIWWSWWNEWLDEQTLWIRKGKTYRIWSPSGVGKTNLVYWTIKSLLEQWAKVLFISLENDIETTYSKFLSSVQGVNNRDIEQWKVNPDTDWLRKYKDKFILTDQLFELDEIKREVLKVKPDVVLLDYIGLVTIDGVRDADKIYTPYAKKVKEFVQKNKIAWIDLSNLNTGETEEEIRKHWKFNWSASLKNNTDFGLHIFHYKPFYEYKEFAESDKFNSLKVVTFYISKNRMWVDFVEKEYWIDFNKGINYVPIPEEKKELWKAI